MAAETSSWQQRHQAAALKAGAGRQLQQIAAYREGSSGFCEKWRIKTQNGSGSSGAWQIGGAESRLRRRVMANPAAGYGG